MSGILSAALEHEHRLIDDAIETFAGSDTSEVSEQQRAGLTHAITLLRRHIYLEEEFLFPPLRDAGLIGPVMVMVHEHGQMWPLLNLLEQLLTAGSSGTAGSLCRDLLGQLATHNLKEERILYPQIDELLPAADLADVTGLLATAQAPAGWVCHGAPSR